MPVCRQKTVQLKERNRGGVTLLSLLTVLAALLLSSTCLYLAQADLRMTSRQVQSRQALYLAEAGIEMARCQLAGNPSWQPEPEYLLTTGSFSVTVERVNPGYFVVVSTAKGGEAVKKLQVHLQEDGAGALKIVSYTEVYN